MTMEINEIGITMRVRSDATPMADAAAEGDAQGAPAASSMERDELVELCVRRVLRALRNAQER